MTTINTNISALIGMNNLRLTNLGLQQSLERLSSGLRINRGADDPSGLAVGTRMAAQINGIRTAVQNMEDNKSLIQTADGALAETQNILFRMRDLAVRAANVATLTTTDISRINNELQSLKAELARKSTSVTFNSKILFSGSFSAGFQMQVGPDNSAVMHFTLSISAMTLTGLQFATTDFWGATAGSLIISNTTTGTTVLCFAQMAIDYINSAINIVSNSRANIGIQERRLDYIINDLKAEDINTSAAKSRIMDADMASEISDFTRLQILQQSGTAILAQANAQPQSILQLLR